MWAAWCASTEGFWDAAATGRRAPEGSIETLYEYYNRTFTSDYLTGGTDVTATRPARATGTLIRNGRRGYGTEARERPVYSVKAAVRLAEGKLPLMEVSLGDFSAKAQAEETLPPALRPAFK